MVAARQVGIKAKYARNSQCLNRIPCAMPDLANDSGYRLTLPQADQAREDFAAIFDELDFVRSQLFAAAEARPV